VFFAQTPWRCQFYAISLTLQRWRLHLRLARAVIIQISLHKLGRKKNTTCQIDRTRMSLRTSHVLVLIVSLRVGAGTNNGLQGAKTESLRTKEEGALSEKSARNGLDDAAKPNTVPHHSAFRLKMQRWPCEAAQKQ
jgi:hypothetical protein